MIGKKSNTAPPDTHLLEQAAAEAIKELADTRRIRPVAEAKNLARKMMGKKAEEKDLFYWPAGMLALGLAECGLQAGKAAIEEHIRIFYKKGGKLYYPDDALMGAALLEFIGTQTDSHAAVAVVPAGAGQSQFQEAIEAVYDMVCKTDRDELGSILYRPGRGHTEILADGVGMTAFFLAKYACALMQNLPEESEKRVEREKKAIEAMELAMTQLYNFSSFAQDSDSGLLWHCYEAKEDGGLMRKGLIGWGRAMGWYLMGLSEVVCTMKALGLEEAAEVEPEDNPKPEASEKDGKEETGETTDDTLAELLETYSEKVFSYQQENGLLPWCLTDLVCRNNIFSSVTSQALKDAHQNPENAEDGTVSQILTANSLQTDTSASAMVGYAVLQAVKAGTLDGKVYEDRLASLKKGLESQIDSSGVVKGALAECVGFGIHPQRFGSYAWGQGAVLAFLAAYRNHTEERTSIE